jgi:hypothetical protein
MAKESDKGPLKRVKGWFHRHSSPSSRSVSPNPPPKQDAADTQALQAPIVTTLISGGQNVQISQLTSLTAAKAPLTCSKWTEAPWSEWKVRNDFLEELNLWNEDNPQNAVLVVMKKVQERLSAVSDVLESDIVQEALELIPNAPFPAGLLVKNLLNVLVIGVVSVALN